MSVHSHDGSSLPGSPSVNLRKLEHLSIRHVHLRQEVGKIGCGSQKGDVCTAEEKKVTAHAETATLAAEQMVCMSFLMLRLTFM